MSRKAVIFELNNSMFWFKKNYYNSLTRASAEFHSTGSLKGTTKSCSGPKFPCPFKAIRGSHNLQLQKLHG